MLINVNTLVNTLQSENLNFSNRFNISQELVRLDVAIADADLFAGDALEPLVVDL
jgi:hypothetical protein